MTQSLDTRMPYRIGFPEALGTGIVVRSSRPVRDGTRQRIGEFIHEFEYALSRFRDDSLVAEMGRAEQGGSFDFPDWAMPLFTLYDLLAAASNGAIDPCVGEDLIRLGYGADLRFTMQKGAAGHLGSLHGRPTWRRDVERKGVTLVTRRRVHLDFGACGKGYLVDLMFNMLDEGWGTRTGVRDESGSRAADGNDMFPLSKAVVPDVVIDAGGDLRIRARQPIVIALENPSNTNEAVGTAAVSIGSLCASAPSRRHWGALHHLLNAIDGLPANRVAATWVSTVPRSPTSTLPMLQPTATPSGTGVAHPHVNAFPTALADGLSTALFVVDPSPLARSFDFECAVLYADGHAAASHVFPGRFFS